MDWLLELYYLTDHAMLAAGGTATIKQTATPDNPDQLKGQDGMERWVGALAYSRFPRLISELLAAHR